MATAFTVQHTSQLATSVPLGADGPVLVYLSGGCPGQCSGTLKLEWQRDGHLQLSFEMLQAVHQGPLQLHHQNHGHCLGPLQQTLASTTSADWLCAVSLMMILFGACINVCVCVCVFKGLTIQPQNISSILITFNGNW